MTDFKAKMHQIRFRLGLRPRPRWLSLERSPRPPSWIWGSLRGKGDGLIWEKDGKGEGKGREGKWMGGKRRAPSYCWTRAPQSLATPLHIGRLSRITQGNHRIYLVIHSNFSLGGHSDIHKSCNFYEYRNDHAMRNYWPRKISKPEKVPKCENFCRISTGSSL